MSLNNTNVSEVPNRYNLLLETNSDRKDRGALFPGRIFGYSHIKKKKQYCKTNAFLVPFRVYKPCSLEDVFKTFRKKKTTKKV